MLGNLSLLQLHTIGVHMLGNIDKVLVCTHDVVHKQEKSLVEQWNVCMVAGACTSRHTHESVKLQ